MADICKSSFSRITYSLLINTAWYISTHAEATMFSMHPEDTHLVMYVCVQYVTHTCLQYIHSVTEYKIRGMVDSVQFNDKMKRMQSSNAHARVSMTVVPRSKAVISTQVTAFELNDDLTAHFLKDIGACVENDTITQEHLGFVECVLLHMPDDTKVSWVRVNGKYVYRRASEISQQVETSTVKTCSPTTPHTDNRTCLLSFPQRGTQGQYCNVEMETYKQLDCTMQYGNNFESREKADDEMQCIHYPHGGYDIYIVMLSGDSNVMILSKPLVFKKKYPKSITG
jgi:hypothetical protein